jgi:hypothetical protein
MDQPTVQLVTCKFCLNENVKICLKCKSNYCAIHAAKFSPNFCQECLSNLSVILNTISRTTTEYDLIDEVLYIKPGAVNKLQLDGPDWIFYSTWIENLSEEDWLAVYQFHYFIIKMMEYENEVRKVKQARRVASAPLAIRVTKETKTSKEAKPVDMQTSLEKLKIPIATIKLMLQAAGIAYREPNTNGNG